MKRKDFVGNVTPLLNANVENSIGLLQRMGLLKRTLPCMHCNCSMTWCIYNKMNEK
jgi:hypothetical protein